MQIKVSVIMPAYNAEQYISEAIESWLDQSILEKELIIIDDNSSDNTWSIIQNYTNKYKGIKVFRFETNMGAGAARNKGIEIAEGEYVTFLDSDDYYEDRDALEDMYTQAIIHNKKICGSLRLIKTDSMVEEQDIYDGVSISGEGCEIRFDEYQNDFCYQSFIFYRGMLIDKGIRFPDFRRYQDPPFMLDAMMEAESFWVVPRYLYCYRIGHQDSEFIGKRIEETIKGLMYTTRIACERSYTKLLQRNKDRLDHMYYADVMKQMNERLLYNVNILNYQIKEYLNEDLRIIKEICSICNMDNLVDSHAIYEGLINLNLSKEWDAFFEKRIVKKIAVYGIGRFGKLFLESINGCKVEVVACIDRNVEKYKNYCVLKPSDPIPDCDLIVISINSYKKISEPATFKNHKVSYLSELMWEYKKEMEI